MSDRLYLAAEVTRRLNYIRHDTLELARLLRGETLSEGFHETLLATIGELQKLAASARPAESPVEPEAPVPEQKETQPRVLERADAA
jgi:hypothetical protein